VINIYFLKGRNMPHVHVKMYPGRTGEQKKAFTDRIVKAMEETMGVEPRWISVSYEEIGPEEWDEKVVKPDIAAKKEFLFKPPEYESKYFSND